MTKKKRPLDEEEVERVRRALPMKPPEGTIEELQRLGYLKGELYLFEKDYVRDPITGMKSAAVKAYCTACGGTYWYAYAAGSSCVGYGESYGFYLDLVTPEAKAKKNGDSFVCPECGQLVTARRKGAYNHSYEIGADSVECCHLLNVEGHLTAIKWQIYKKYTKDGRLVWSHVRDEATAVIDRHLCRYTGHGAFMGNYYSRGDWYTVKEHKDRIRDVKRGAVLFEPGVEIGTDSENCGITAFLGGIGKGKRCTPGAYLQLWCQRPNAENLSKAGLSEYLQACMADAYQDAVSYYGYGRSTNTFQITKLTDVDFKRVKPHEMLGVEKYELELARDPMVKPECFRFYKAVKASTGVRLTREQLIFCGTLKQDALKCLAFGEFHGFMPPVERMVNYLKKQVERLGPEIVTVSYLRDYWDSVYKVYGRMEPSMLWPSDLRRAHDSMLNRVKYKVDEALREKFKKRKRELMPLAFVSEEMGLEIFPAGSEAELIREGDKLHHCVARYAKDHANGKTAILFIRRVGNRKEPFYTLEWRNGKINQNHGDRNSLQTEEIFAFEKLWLAHVASLKGVEHGKQATERVRAGA